MEDFKNTEGTVPSIRSEDASVSNNAVMYKGDVENQSDFNNHLGTTTDEKAFKNPNIVDWDGPNDPANPMNWSSGKKVAAIGVVSVITTIS